MSSASGLLAQFGGSATAVSSEPLDHEYELCLKAISKRDDNTKMSGWTKLLGLLQAKLVDAEAEQETSAAAPSRAGALRDSFQQLLERVPWTRLWLEVAASDPRVRLGMVSTLGELVGYLGKHAAGGLNSGAAAVWLLLLFDASNNVAAAAKKEFNRCFVGGGGDCCPR